MPRARKSSKIGAEDSLAKRIKFEKDARGWSYAELSRRLSEAGVELNPSSLQKTCNPPDGPDKQPRPIRVDELVAFAKVFGTTTDKLLEDQEYVNSEIVAKAMSELARADDLLVEAAQVILDNQVTLARAVEFSSNAVKADLVGGHSYWWKSIDGIRTIPKEATKDSLALSPEGVIDALKFLKAVIAFMAVKWVDDETLRERGQGVPEGPQTGSREWVNYVMTVFERGGQVDAVVGKAAK
jgi:hypothetical protein